MRSGRAAEVVRAEDVHSARRRVMAMLDMELDEITTTQARDAEQASLFKGGRPAISEACEPHELPSTDAPCDGLPNKCPLREKCWKWLNNTRGKR